MDINTLAVTTGQAEPDAPTITVDGKDLEVKLSEDAIRSHLRSLACDYCREMLIRMAGMGQDLYIGERPKQADVAAFTTCLSQTAHDANHDVWHAWNDQARKAKKAIRERENKVYSEMKSKGLRGLKLRDEVKKALAALPKIEVPKLPQLTESYTKVERPVPVRKAKPKAGFKHKENDAKAEARAASVQRTLDLLAKVAAGRA